MSAHFKYNKIWNRVEELDSMQTIVITYLCHIWHYFSFIQRLLCCFKIRYIEKEKLLEICNQNSISAAEIET